MRNLTSIIFSLTFILFIACQDKAKVNTTLPQIDQQLEDYQLETSTSKKLEILNQLNQSLSQKPDSLQVAYLSTLAYNYYKLDQLQAFKQVNQNALTKALSLQKWYHAGDAEWNWASYYVNGQVYDSAYFHFKAARNYFNKSQHTYEAARVTYGMAYIRKIYRDYSGSESLLFELLGSMKESEKNTRTFYDCYNLLGGIYSKKKEFATALDYFNLSANYIDQHPYRNEVELGFRNNRGNTYHEMQEYHKAIADFSYVLNHPELEQNSDLHARVLDNLANSRLKLGDTLGLTALFKTALNIRDSLGDRSGEVFTNIHLLQYYRYANKLDKAIQLGKENLVKAKRLKSQTDYLNLLSLMADIDTINAKHYLDTYIATNDSLSTVERESQNKFTRIVYETEQYKAQTKRLTRQNLWLIGGGFILILGFTLIYLIRNQRSLKERLALESDIQSANEEVYQMTLKRQIELEKERLQERNRIAEDLHDSVLSQLFATRLHLSYLPVVKSPQNEKLQNQYLGELQDIEKEIRDVSHQLSNQLSNTEFGFSKALELLVIDKAEIGKLEPHITIQNETEVNQLSKQLKVTIYRILQEALQNIIKHAQATTVDVKLELSTNLLSLSIKDNGTGITTQHKKGIGIKNMTSRAKAVKACFAIKQRPTKGTAILVEFNL